MNTTFLLTGGNMGERSQNLSLAAELIAKRIGEVKKASSVYETAAWGKVAQPDYLNQVLEVKTRLQPQELLAATLQIEAAMGRHRDKMWGPRVIDIDILFYNESVIREEKLIIPHPHMQDRKFVLTPLSEIAPKVVHPVLKKTILELLDSCPDPLWTRKLLPSPDALLK